MKREYIPRDQFDFEVGYLVESPCPRCAKRELFPVCMDACDTLKKIQSMLARGIACSRQFSD